MLTLITHLARSRHIRFIAFVFGLSIATLAVSAASLTPADLKCEERVNPLGIDTPQPRLSWLLKSDQRGDHQSAYQIIAASTLAKLDSDQPDLWDSGKILTNASLNILFEGAPLHSGQRIFWKTRVWDSTGHVSRYSSPAWFEMALLAPADWQAKWIQRQPETNTTDPYADHPAPLLRKSFPLDKKIARARAYVSGLGYFELRLNGERVGDDVLNPGWTTYAQRVLYSTYDVTTQLQRGQNAIGVMLGNGWFHPLPLALWGRIKPSDALLTGEPRAIVQLVVEFTDGSSQTIVSDESWRASAGPILRNNVYLGEVYDARHEQPGWDKKDFDDSHWEPAALSSEPKLGPLVAQDAPPIRVTRTLKPVKLTEPKPGVFIFDLGQNFSGWASLHVKGAAGTRVRLRSGELLYPDGSLNGMTAVVGQIKNGGKDYVYDDVGQPQTAFQIDEYVLNGQGTETFTPRFTFHGFRYVEVTGFPGKLTLDSLEGLRLNADVQPAGSFECSNDLFNRIEKIVRWTQLANLFSVQSDCPHREKFGYGGDITVSSESLIFNWDMSRFYAKVAQDFVDAARPNGAFTETAPFVGISDQNLGDGPAAIALGPEAGPVDFGVAQPLIAWQLYQYYGDRRVLERQYLATKRWIDLLRSKSPDGLFDNGISDHEGLDPKPRWLTGTALYYYNVKLFAQIATVLGKEDDARDALAETENIKAAFNHKFLQAGTGRYDTATQTCQALPLYFGLVPDDEKARTVEVLLHDIQEKQGHLSTGIFGTKYMLNALTDLGHADAAYEIANQRTFPGWGYMLANGATTLWETWAISDNVYSRDHPMFGSISEWFYKCLAGIAPASDAIGFDHIILQPHPVGDLKWVKASYDSAHGKIVSEWTHENGQFKLHVTIPVGSRATLHLPSGENSKITESGKLIVSALGIELLTQENHTAILNLQSGDYHFASTIK